MEHRKIKWHGMRSLSPLLLSRWRRSIRECGCSAEAAQKALERIRERYKFGTAELAELLGSSVSAVRSWENGQRKPSLPVRRLIHLTEQTLEQLPPGEWRRIVWGWPLAGIIAFRKGEMKDYFKVIEEQKREKQRRSTQKLVEDVTAILKPRPYT